MTAERWVVDASALLAMLGREPGGDAVAMVLSASFGVTEAETAAGRWHRGGQMLAFADRACLATAAVRGHPVLTADRALVEMELGIPVQLIR